MVFVSWSGEPSRSAASALGRLLTRVIQSLDVWISDQAITGGQRWNTEITRAIEAADFGLICLTRSNQHAPWLMFEAGALATKLDPGRLIPLTVDMPWSDVTGPLQPIQGHALDHDGVRRVVHALNAASERPMAGPALDETFERWWLDLETALAELPASEAPIGDAREQRKQILLRALRGENDWRRLDRLSRLVGLPDQETRDLLIEVGARASTSRRSSDELWGLISRVGSP
jgi:hypothetical protein